MGASGPLQDPLDRKMAYEISRYWNLPPESLQGGLMREMYTPQSFETPLRGAMEGGQPPTSVGEARRTPPMGAGGPMRQPSRLEMIAQLLSEKRGVSPREREMERMLSIPEAERTPDHNEILFQYMMGDPKEPGSALDRLALLYAQGKGGEPARRAFEAKIKQAEGSPEKVQLLGEQLALAQARINHLVEMTTLGRRKLEEVEKPKVGVEVSEEARKKAEAGRKVRETLQADLNKTNQNFGIEMGKQFNEEGRNEVRRRYLTHVQGLFRTAIDHTPDEEGKAALREQEKQVLRQYRPPLVAPGGKPSLGF
jgi:hypothetical protein